MFVFQTKEHGIYNLYGVYMNIMNIVCGCFCSKSCLEMVLGLGGV